MKLNEKEKVPVRRLLSNVSYVLRYALEKDRGIVIMVISLFAVSGIGYACMDTVFLRAFITFLTDPRISFGQTAILVTGATLGMAVLMAFDGCTESFAQARLVRMTGQIQEEMIRRASGIDMMCYDCDTYFEDFVLAASQSEEMVNTCIFDFARMIRNVLTVLVLSGLITSIDPVVAIFPIVGFLVNIVTRFRIMALEYEYSVEKTKIMRRAQYSKRVFYQPEYAKELKLSHIETALEKQFHEAIDDNIQNAKRVGKGIAFWSLANWITVFTFLSFFCVPLYLGYLALIKGSILLGDVAALNNAQANLRGKFDSVNYCLERLQTVGQYTERFRRFMEYESKIEGSRGSVKIPSEPEKLEIRDMSFRYDGAREDTLKHITMTIRPGERIALVGENGAGKSTFVKLLLRLYDATGGGIFYGGEDIRSFATEEYRELFGMVFQDYQIYAASLLDNVRMRLSQGNPHEAEEEARQALEKAGFAQRLESLPQGLATPLTREFDDKGIQLSGGEAQKVAISRLFARRKKMAVAILDEPSSALDPKAEYLLNQNMLHKAGDAAVIFISHRLSTTRDADRIYMFEQGEIVEQGTHQELMGLNGKYAEMFRCQAKYYQENAQLLY